MIGREIAEIAFELGHVLLKTHLEKGETHETIRAHGGTASERVVLQKFGKFWNQQKWLDRPDGLVVVTTERLAFLAKLKSITVTTDYLSFPFEDIRNLAVTRVMLVSPAIKFDVRGQPFVFTFFTNAEEVASAIEAQRRAKAQTPI